MRRELSLERLRRGEELDLLIIGGGINGAAIAREAQARGLSVALVDKGDFASGTSSRSSRLVHGGLRYLEHGAFGQVRRSLAERAVLLATAPHLVRPIRFLAPAWGDSRYGVTALGLGVAIYELLAGRHRLGRRERIGPGDMAEREPDLRRDRLQGAIAFDDAITDDARLVLALVRSAWIAGAAAVNYAAAQSLLHEGGIVRGARVVDQVRGEVLDVRARAVVNATGPWAQAVAELDGERRSFLRLTRGTHVVVPRASRAPLVLPTRDGRVLFVLPAGPCSILGTTDVDHDGSLDEVAASEEEVRFLLEEAGRALPRAALSRDRVIASFAAVRPLIAAPGAPGSLSREHRIERGRSGLVSVIGGKLTTHRALAEEVVDVLAKDLGRPVGASPTATMAVDGADMPDFRRFLSEAATEVRARLGGSADLAERLIRSYGTRVAALVKLAGEEPELVARLCRHHDHLALEAAYAARDEMAVTLADFLFRRTRIAFGRCRGEDCAEAAAEAMAGVLGWSKARRADEVAAFLAESQRLARPRER